MSVQGEEFEQAQQQLQQLQQQLEQQPQETPQKTKQSKAKQPKKAKDPKVPKSTPSKDLKGPKTIPSSLSHEPIQSEWTPAQMLAQQTQALAHAQAMHFQAQAQIQAQAQAAQAHAQAQAQARAQEFLHRQHLHNQQQQQQQNLFLHHLLQQQQQHFFQPQVQSLPSFAAQFGQNSFHAQPPHIQNYGLLPAPLAHRPIQFSTPPINPVLYPGPAPALPPLADSLAFILNPASETVKGPLLVNGNGTHKQLVFDNTYPDGILRFYYCWLILCLDLKSNGKKTKRKQEGDVEGTDNKKPKKEQDGLEINPNAITKGEPEDAGEAKANSKKRGKAVEEKGKSPKKKKAEEEQIADKKQPKKKGEEPDNDDGKKKATKKKADEPTTPTKKGKGKKADKEETEESESKESMEARIIYTVTYFL